MRLILGASFIVVASYAGVSPAADMNGYTSTYECRASGPVCNIDISALVTAPCDVTVYPSDPDWSKITNNNSARFFCLAAGDHSGKGTLSLGNSGSGSARKVLRYYSGSDNDANPWNQGTRAVVRKLDFRGASYWVVHRITIDGGGATQDGIFIATGSNSNIMNRVLVQQHHGYQVIADWNGPTDSNVIQNSVIRKAVLDTVIEDECIDPEHSSNMRIINNEIYDCHKALSVGSGVGDTRGLVVENNDFYASDEFRTDCRGNFNGIGPCSGSEAIMSIKAGGVADNPAMYIHNRIWGGRTGDGNLIGFDSSGSGAAVSISGSGPDNPGLKTDYLLFMNNIVMDSQHGIGGWWGPDTHNSVIGNIIYKIHQYSTNSDSWALTINAKQNSEWYLNTIIDTDRWLGISGSDASGGPDMNNDIRCNLVINGGGSGIGPGSGTVIDNNAFYGTTPYTTNSGSTSNIVRSNASDAQMTSYCFYRKLQTGPEQACIPNARSQTSSPHYKACDSTLGLRSNVGISDAPLF
ncbi:MAG: hypothetical protein ACJ8NR_12385 [Sulfurifustis sp.]